MSDKTPAPYPNSKLRFVDILVLITFTLIAVFGLYLFQQDLMRTMDLMDVDPAGTIIIRNNVIQRRHENRALWERLFVDSSVYPGDLIRAADLSSASINIAKNEITVNENTLIRIQMNTFSPGAFQIELQEGNISVSSSEEGSGIMLNLMGQFVQAMSGAVLDLSAGEEGIAVQVNEGSAALIRDGQSRSITEGAIVAFDTAGTERVIPTVVMRRPSNNARFLNNSGESRIVDFEWNRSNIGASEELRMEIAWDNDFKNIVNVINAAGDSVQVPLDIGQWFWRILHDDNVLRRGQVLIADSSGTVLITPVSGSIFRYNSGYPQMRFQWAEKESATGYVIEINNTQDFSAPFLRRQTSAPSFIVSELGHGTWYWRVRAVFPSVFAGETGYSRAGSFRIEQTNAPLDSAAAVEIPPAAIEEARTIAAQEPAARSAVSVRASPTLPREVREVRVRSGTAAAGTQQITTQRIRAAEQTTYIIQSGDTLGRIANRFYNDAMQWGRIADVNNIRNPDLIYPGQVLIIP